RRRLGFGGVVFSDDMEMKAVRGRFPLDEQLREATEGSVDVFLFCKEPALQVEAWELLVRQQEDGKRQEDLAIAAVKRWPALRSRFLLSRPEPPPLSALGEGDELALRARVEGA